MKELFIPYKFALELKNKGFDEPCLAFWEEGLNSPRMWDYWSILLRNSTNEDLK